MSFHKAKQMFEDNIKNWIRKEDPSAHNLNAGLLQLTKDLENRLNDLERKIVHVSQQVGQLQR